MYLHIEVWFYLRVAFEERFVKLENDFGASFLEQWHGVLHDLDGIR